LLISKYIIRTWIIEIGPEAAHRGGELVFEGPPYKLPGVSGSVTAPFLQ